MVKRKITSRDDWFVDTFALGLTCLFVLLILIPMFYVIASSFSSPDDVIAGRVYLWPKNFTLEGYLKIFDYDPIWLGYRNTVIYTVLGTIISLVVMLPCAYALSRPDFVGRNLFTFLFTLTMFFSGGLIPTYMVVRDIGLLDSMWAIILPSCCSMYNIIIARTYFQTSIPAELREAAVIDGCTNTRLFVKIILPLSKPIIIVLMLFCAVSQWNSFFNALIYVNDTEKLPLQIFLRNILLMDQVVDLAGLDSESTIYLSMLLKLKESMKYGIIVVSTLPLLVLSATMQKFFIKGMMIGAVKG